MPTSVYLAMRSLFRLVECIKMKSSKLIIDNESSILKKRITELQAPELEYFISNWKAFFINESKEQVINDNMILKQLRVELLLLN